MSTIQGNLGMRAFSRDFYTARRENSRTGVADKPNEQRMNRAPLGDCDNKRWGDILAQ